MRTVAVDDLSGSALDWAVAKAEGHDVLVLTVAEQRARWLQYVPPDEMEKEALDFDEHMAPTAKAKVAVAGDEGYKRGPSHAEALMLWGQGIPKFQYSTSWAQGGPIIEREMLTVAAEGKPDRPVWVSSLTYPRLVVYTTGAAMRFCSVRGPTPLIAAMRCYCCAKLGDQVEVPEELL